jgi:O-antigen/teichoic acid export membrane protein
MVSILQRGRKLVAGRSLATKILRGGAWLGTGSTVEQVFRFVRNMVLTRLLAPEAFGLMAIILSISSAVDTFTEIGVREAIIQNPKGHEDRYVNSAWWLSLSRSLGLYVLVFISAPWIAHFYNNQEMTRLVRVALLSIVFVGATSSKAFVALKEMQFKRWAIIQHGGGLCGSVITLTLALFIRGVWALAIGFALENLIRCVVSYVICPFRPKLEIDKDSAKDLLTFSKRVFGLSFLNLVFGRTDVFVLGRLYPAAELGIYTMGIYLVQVPAGFVMNMLGQVLMPTFAQLQHDHRRTNQLLARVTSIVILLALPALVFLVVSGRNLLGIFYGRRYSAAYLPLVVAGFVALINVVNAQITTILYASGRPQLHRRCVAIMAAAMIILIYPLVKYFGMVGGQVACLISVLIGYFIQVIQVRELTGFHLTSQTKSFVVAAATSFSVLIILFAARGTTLMITPSSNIALGLAASGLVLGLSSFVFAREISEQTRRLIAG